MTKTAVIIAQALKEEGVRHAFGIPGGEVLEVQLVKSSGDPAFDRSAENAVRLAGRLPVPGDPAVFSNYFRQFKFLFRPEGLRQ